MSEGFEISRGDEMDEWRPSFAEVDAAAREMWTQIGLGKAHMTAYEPDEEWLDDVRRILIAAHEAGDTQTLDLDHRRAGEGEGWSFEDSPAVAGLIADRDRLARELAAERAGKLPRDNTGRREQRALNYRCPYCKAEPGEPCKRRYTGAPANAPHGERMKLTMHTSPAPSAERAGEPPTPDEVERLREALSEAVHRMASVAGRLRLEAPRIARPRADADYLAEKLPEFRAALDAARGER